MDITISERIKELLLLLILLILPWVMIIIGIFIPIENAWYFLIAITWFGSGVVFFSAVH